MVLNLENIKALKSNIDDMKKNNHQYTAVQFGNWESNLYAQLDRFDSIDIECKIVDVYVKGLSSYYYNFRSVELKTRATIHDNLIIFTNGYFDYYSYLETDGGRYGEENVKTIIVTVDVKIENLIYAVVGFPFVDKEKALKFALDLSIENVILVQGKINNKLKISISRSSDGDKSVKFGKFEKLYIICNDFVERLEFVHKIDSLTLLRDSIISKIKNLEDSMKNKEERIRTAIPSSLELFINKLFRVNVNVDMRVEKLLKDDRTQCQEYNKQLEVIDNELNELEKGNKWYK